MKNKMAIQNCSDTPEALERRVKTLKKELKALTESSKKESEQQAQLNAFSKD